MNTYNNLKHFKKLMEDDNFEAVFEEMADNKSY